MLSTIELKDKLGKLFESKEGLIDVYATPDFSFNQDSPVLTILCKDTLDVALFYYALIDLLPEIKHFYATRNNMDSILQDKKIIWRKGVWYV